MTVYLNKITQFKVPRAIFCEIHKCPTIYLQVITESWFLIGVIRTLHFPVTYLAWWHTLVLTTNHSGVIGNGSVPVRSH